MKIFKIVTSVFIAILMIVWFLSARKDKSIYFVLAVCEMVYIMSLIAIWG